MAQQSSSLNGYLPYESKEPIPCFLRLAFEEGVCSDGRGSHSQTTSSPRRVISGRREETPVWTPSVPAELRPATGKFINELEHPFGSHGYFTTSADCIALTTAEADEPCGQLTTKELMTKILKFRGKLFPVESPITAKYQKLASEETGVPLSEAEHKSLGHIEILLRCFQTCVERVANKVLKPEAAFEEWKQFDHAMLDTLMRAPWQLWMRYAFRTQLHFAREYIQNDVCKWEKHFLAAPEPPGLSHFAQSDMLRQLREYSSLYEFAHRFFDIVLVLPPHILANSDHHMDHTENWLACFIQNNTTFGTVHAWATACHTNPYLQLEGPENVHPSFCQMQLCHLGHTQHEGDDQSKNSEYIQFINCSGPRRVWDVCSNRVVPFEWFADPLFFLPHMEIRNRLWPISHSWVAANDREIIYSNVNNRQWPIPIPKGVSLEDVREELLGMNCQYTWLDVLCLRQEYPGQKELEDVRLHEWKTDIPTIGFTYRAAECVITYFNGIGRAFKPLDTFPWRDDDRHWLNRVWTFQETKHPEDIIVGGLHGGMVNPLRRPRQLADPGFPMALRLADHFFGTERLKGYLRVSGGEDLYGLVTKSASEELRGRLIDAVVLLRKRHTTNPVDIIASLAYQHAESMLNIDSLVPVYLAHESVAEAWLRFVIGTTKHDYVLAIQYQLMRAFPFPSPKHWFPNWEQVAKYPDVGFSEPQEPDAAVDPHMYLRLTRPGTQVFRHCRIRTTEKSINTNLQLRTMWKRGIVPIWLRQDNGFPSSTSYLKNSKPSAPTGTESRKKPEAESIGSTIDTTACLCPDLDSLKTFNIPSYHFERQGAVIEFDTATQPSVNIGICQYREAVITGLSPPVPDFFPYLDENSDYTLVYVPFENEKHPALLTESKSHEYASILIVCREIDITEYTDGRLGGFRKLPLLRRVTSFNCTEGSPFISKQEVALDTPWSQPDYTVAGLPGVAMMSCSRIAASRQNTSEYWEVRIV